jgi:hypothetical protein
MIELIITIVLIGIIFAAIPGLLARAVEADTSSLEGEALYHAAAKMQEIVAQPHNSILNKDAYKNKPYVVYYDGGAICGGGTETKGIQELKNTAPIDIGGLKRDAMCPDKTPQYEDITLAPVLQSAINEYNGWRQTDFSQGYTLEVAITPLQDNRVVSGYTQDLNLSEWTATSPATTPRDLLLITITASYSDTGETIGVLRYAASNVGKR